MLLKLRDIGKIYETNNLYTIGIRHIDLEFSLNEFVTIEGESGSGKSTLLNVIGANDTYEEGELFFNGSETSHYSIGEWDNYRERNIATIFQDFNIIENLTVLENVEIALLRIKSLKERRIKAKELIDRVGLTKQTYQKASKLSGGEKQRTVIARALAKDAPIILADEPTGNLDVKSSHEISHLLKEVSKDKLIIVVTHNPEFFKDERTRSITLKDGSVTSDKTYIETEKQDNETIFNAEESKETKTECIKNTLWLGTLNYKSRPKFTILMSFILIVFAISLFFVLAIFSDNIISPITKTTETHPVTGKLLVTNKDKPITKEEYDTLVETLNPGYSFSDYYLTNFDLTITKANKNIMKEYKLKVLYDPYKHNLEEDTAVLEISYTYRSDIDELVKIIKNASVGIDSVKVKKVLKIKEPILYVSQETLKKHGKLFKAIYSTLTLDTQKENIYTYRVNKDLKEGEINLVNSKIWEAKNKFAILDIYAIKTFKVNDDTKSDNSVSDLIVELNPNDYQKIFENTFENYSPAFYFPSNRKATTASKKLGSDYVGLLSSAKLYLNGAGNIFFYNTIAYLVLVAICFILGMIISIIFSKNVRIFGADFAIYRTLGITRRTAKNSLYIQMLLIFLPTIIALPLVAVIASITPNSMIKFISFGNYLFIELMMIVVVEIVAFRFNKSIVLKSIRKSLARGLK